MKTLICIGMISLFILIGSHQVYAVAERRDFPVWFHALHAKINKAFHIEAKRAFIREPDRIKHNEYFSFSLRGNGYLEKVPDPFEEMEKLFLADGWKMNERYQADGHGSSSFAYEKGELFCLISVSIDSSCDEEEDHTPSEFWFTIYCREHGQTPEKEVPGAHVKQ